MWDALICERPRVASTGKRLAPYEAHVLATVVFATDLWGWTWGQSSKWLKAITGVSPERCRLAMKAGVELGVFFRDRIPRGGRFPYRPAGKDGWRVPPVPGEGQDAPFGGFLYRVAHAWKWKISPANYRVGDFRIAIQMDRYPGSPSLLTDLALLRRSKKEIPASPQNDDLACSRELAPAADVRPPETAPPPAANVASETPRAADLAGAAQSVSGREPEIEKLKGGASTPAEPSARAAVAVRPEEIRDFMLSMWPGRRP